MSRQFERGLVVGKFCPLHRGHELLIESASARCRELVLISYTKPEFPRCAPAARARWLAARFPDTQRLVIDDEGLRALCIGRGLEPRRVPHNDAPEAEHRDFCAWLCDGVLGVQMDAVFSSESYGEGFAAALARAFGRPVQHVAVDPARELVPASGTQLRADPHAHRDLLAPEVYADFVERVCILGGESSGKSTLARALADALGTHCVPEYGRELWIEQQGTLDYPDLLRVAEEQIAREDRAAREADRWLICDTSPLTTLGYSQWMFGRADPRLVAFAARAYDRVLLCAGDFDFVQDGTRRNHEFRARQHAWYVQELGQRGIAYRPVEGSPEQRLRCARAYLDEPSLARRC